MPLYDFSDKQQFTTIDKLPDLRSDAERLNSQLSVYNHDNPDITYAERLAEEMINLSGAWVTVFKRLRNEANKDELWEEDADPTYKNGTKLKGFFAPQPAEAQVTRWGIDTENEMVIHFARPNVLKLFGEQMIAEGDVLIIPHNTLAVTQNTDLRTGIGNKLDRYRVIKSTDSGNFHYRWLYWSCKLQSVLGDKSTDVESKVTA